MPADRALSGHKRHVVVLSDVHLGTDAPTVWFQPAVHEPYLAHLLRWVVDHADQVLELVLLGDIVDLWTYPAAATPPTFADIAACHPTIFGPDGHLAAALDALDGRVSYVPGNHDLGVTADEVGAVVSPGGHRLRLVDDVPYCVAPGVLVEHGHHHTMYNAPTDTSPWAPLPLGYFVTRAVATQWSRQLGPDQTVADLAGQGAPNGIDLTSLASVVSGVRAGSIAASLVDFVSGATGVALDEPIVMPDGSTATLADARAAYASCWTEWSDAAGGGIVGQGVAGRAALADLDGSFLGWFAQRRALEHGAELVVMGHTHLPIGALDEALVDYANAGFDCPSSPDMARAVDPQQVTFAVIDLASAGTSADYDEADGIDDPVPEASIWAVEATEDGGFACAPIDAPHTRVVSSRAADYSCYVIIDNTAGAVDLELVGHEAPNGVYVVAPPARVPAGSEGRFWLQDLLGAAGSAGSATYRFADGDPDADPLVFQYACPTVGTNTAVGPGEIATKTASGPWRDGRVAHWGHPFFAAFVVR